MEAGAQLFQSTPGLLAGRYLIATTQRMSWLMFQSTPGLLAGRYQAPEVGQGAGDQGFNPRPAY